MTKVVRTFRVTVTGTTQTVLSTKLSGLTAGWGVSSFSAQNDFDLRGTGTTAINYRAPDGCTPLDADNTANSRGIASNLYYGNNVPWNGDLGKVQGFGAREISQSNPIAQTLIEYDEATNAWSRLVNPANSTFFTHVLDNCDYRNGYLYKYDWVNNRFFSWNTTTRLRETTYPLQSFGSGASPAMAIHPGLGTQGGMIVTGFASSLGTVYYLNFATNSWTTLANNLNMWDGALCHYNPNGDAVIFGGGYSGPRNWYRLTSSNGVPQITNLGLAPEEFTLFQGATHAMVVPSPFRAESIAYSNSGNIYRLDYTTGWDPAPVGTVPSYWRDLSNTDRLLQTVTCSIPNRGIMFIQSRNFGNDNVAFLHKPSTI